MRNLIAPQVESRLGLVDRLCWFISNFFLFLENGSSSMIMIKIDHNDMIDIQAIRNAPCTRQTSKLQIDKMLQFSKFNEYIELKTHCKKSTILPYFAILSASPNRPISIFIASAKYITIDNQSSFPCIWSRILNEILVFCCKVNF